MSYNWPPNVSSRHLFLQFLAPFLHPPTSPAGQVFTLATTFCARVRIYQSGTVGVGEIVKCSHEAEETTCVISETTFLHVPCGSPCLCVGVEHILGQSGPLYYRAGLLYSGDASKEHLASFPTSTSRTAVLERSPQRPTPMFGGTMPAHGCFHTSCVSCTQDHLFKQVRERRPGSERMRSHSSNELDFAVNRLLGCLPRPRLSR